MNATRCRRCDDDLRGAPMLCARCSRLAEDVILAVKSGVRRSWRLEPMNSYEPSAFAVEILDDDRIVASFASKPYRIAWLRFAGFVSREAALAYRLDRIERDERRQSEQLDEQRRLADEAVRDAEACLDEALREARAVDESFARQQQGRSARRSRLVREMESMVVPSAF